MDANAESYDLKDLRHLVTEVLPLVFELKLKFAEGITRISNNIDSYQNLRLHAVHKELIDEAKKRVHSGYKAAIHVTPISEKFHLDLLRFYIDHLLQQNITHTRRVYDPNTRKPSTGGFVWDSWNNEVLASNLQIVIQNLKRVYQILLERHFPGIAKELNLFSEGNLILYCLSFEHGRHAGPQLEYYKMRSRAKLPDEIKFSTDTERPFTLNR